MPKEISSASEFNQELAGAGQKLVVVDFHATWCGPCHAIAPTYAQLASKHASTAIFLKVDVDRVAEVAQRYGVRAMPTFLFIRNKSVLDTLKGADPSKLKSLVEKYIAASGVGAAFSGAGSTLGGNSTSSSSSARTGGAAAAPRASNPNLHGLADKNIKLEQLLPLIVLGAYLFYILTGWF
ncbi:hypothetical protein OC846_000790 [Tilletia horrida]|uniref:Thioredoxin domain-containing protein n=1 Tax=Tilletia horrida TaxID=155126 RepID=A0AAN6GXH2_9BASI|nr:hypothetical protein OC846_000790 [Tilletia horrida]KAK0567820.1 hypothetical protein OC861_002489 [Tilletia horrida]